jgi:hypothetical protein
MWIFVCMCVVYIDVCVCVCVCVCGVIHTVYSDYFAILNKIHLSMFVMDTPCVFCVLEIELSNII